MNRAEREARDARIIAAYRAGATMEEAGRRHGLTKSAVREVLARHDVPRRQVTRWSDAQREAIAERNAAIREAAERGASRGDIAVQLGVSYTTVSAVLKAQQGPAAPAEPVPQQPAPEPEPRSPVPSTSRVGPGRPVEHGRCHRCTSTALTWQRMGATLLAVCDRCQAIERAKPLRRRQSA